MKQQEEKFSVDLLSTEHNGVTYGAGACHLRLGGTPLGRSIACVAGEKRWVTTPLDAKRWFVQYGCPSTSRISWCVMPSRKTRRVVCVMKTWKVVIRNAEVVDIEYSVDADDAKKAEMLALVVRDPDNDPRFTRTGEVGRQTQHQVQSVKRGRARKVEG
jgi:hypothetical protein